MASSLAARIQEEFGVTPELIGGGGGIFEVTINDTVVFSHRGSRNLIPKDEELIRVIRGHLDELS
jgi:hypothetical protein